MHNTTEIEKGLENYPLIPMNEIEDEARLLAVRWVENYGTMGFDDLQNKHKLASDIMNYAKRKKLNSDSTAENKGQQKGEEGDDEKLENDFVERMINELPEYGIDTSKWEYDYGDCCYGGAMEFISRIIKGASEPPEELQEEVERLRLVASEYGKLVDQVRQQLKVAVDEIYRLKNDNEWISVSERTPGLIKDKKYSENVLAMLDGELAVMAYCYIDGEDGGFFWANCYGVINGDSEWDDEYQPTHWRPFPQPPNK